MLDGADIGALTLAAGYLAGHLAVADPEGVAAAAHALKSSCAQLGALDLSELFKQLERLGREGDLADAPGLARQASEEYVRVEAALRRMRDPTA